MINRWHRKSAALAAALLGFTCLASSSAFADGTGLASFSLGFAASGGSPGTPLPVAADPHPMQSKAFNAALETGSPMTADDLLGILVDGQTSSPSTRSSLLDNTTLTVAFQDHRSGQTEHLALADCDRLDFDDRSGTVFEARANCDGVYYTYGVGPGGLEIWREDEVAFQLPLEPGIYALNAIPFVVQATE